MILAELARAVIRARCVPLAAQPRTVGFDRRTSRSSAALRRSSSAHSGSPFASQHAAASESPQLGRSRRPAAPAVRMAWKRWPSWSVKESWAPGCGRSRRTITRAPSGQPVSSSRSVSSATWPFSRGFAVGVERRGPGRLGQGEDRPPDRLGEVIADREADPSVAAEVQQLVGQRRRCRCASRSSRFRRPRAAAAPARRPSTAMWSRASLAPALPGRSRPANGCPPASPSGQSR